MDTALRCGDHYISRAINVTPEMLDGVVQDARSVVDANESRSHDTCIESDNDDTNIPSLVLDDYTSMTSSGLDEDTSMTSLGLDEDTTMTSSAPAEDTSTASLGPIAEDLPPKRGRGRPKGSKNKPKKSLESGFASRESQGSKSTPKKILKSKPPPKKSLESKAPTKKRLKSESPPKQSLEPGSHPEDSLESVSHPQPPPPIDQWTRFRQCKICPHGCSRPFWPLIHEPIEFQEPIPPATTMVEEGLIDPRIL